MFVNQCSQRSGGPTGPGGRTAKSPGPDGTAENMPSSVPNRPVRTPGPWRPIVPSVPGGVGKDGRDGVRLV